MTMKQALGMKGLAIRVDNSGSNSLEGAAYLLAPDATEFLYGAQAPTTAEWKRTLLTTANFILGFDLGSESTLLFLSGSFGGTGGIYAKERGGTFEKVPSVNTATVEASARLGTGLTAQAIVDWVVRQVEQRVGKLEADDAPVVANASSTAITSSAPTLPAAPTMIPANAPKTASSSTSAPTVSATTKSTDVARIADSVAAREADRDDKNTDDLKWQDYSDLGATAANWDLVCEALQRKRPENGDRWYGIL
jgi:hypothetical protein